MTTDFPKPAGVIEPGSTKLLSDDDVRTELVDWSIVVKEENGDLIPAVWAQIDELLDEAHRRSLSWEGTPFA